MIFHLTVNADGVVSLWDTAAQASAQEPRETVVELKLTYEQEQRVMAAILQARARSRS